MQTNFCPSKCAVFSQTQKLYLRSENGILLRMLLVLLGFKVEEVQPQVNAERNGHQSLLKHLK